MKLELSEPRYQWNWDRDQDDRERERLVDAHITGPPLFVDRRAVRTVVQENIGAELAAIEFLSSGTFHKAYLLTLTDGQHLILRVARRFMPRIKVESEVATLSYIRQHTSIPVPTVYAHNSSPYNAVGGEWILMSKAEGIPLGRVYDRLNRDTLSKLMQNLAKLFIPLFAHRFPAIGSIYDASTGGKPIPGKPGFALGPIVSWPFFGSHRGDLPSGAGSNEKIDRGPWTSTSAYLHSCVQREIDGVGRENAGRAAGYRPRLDPDAEDQWRSVEGKRKHMPQALFKALHPGEPEEASDSDSDSGSDSGWSSEEDAMYRDYRATQRGTFLVAHLAERDSAIRREMAHFLDAMHRLGADAGSDEDEQFGIDCHDVSLENVFVDPSDPSRVTCIIDWESTTTRPLWQCAHLPAFLVNPHPGSPKHTHVHNHNLATPLASISGYDSPFFQAPPDAEALFREAVAEQPLGSEWLRAEENATALRAAHKVVEWDGWEDGLVTGILGEVEEEEVTLAEEDSSDDQKTLVEDRELSTHGDLCAGKGGELGRRLEAMLVSTGSDVIR